MGDSAGAMWRLYDYGGLCRDYVVTICAIYEDSMIMGNSGHYVVTMWSLCGHYVVTIWALYKCNHYVDNM